MKKKSLESLLNVWLIKSLFLFQFSELSMMKKGEKEPGSKPGPIKRLCMEERLVELEEELL